MDPDAGDSAREMEMSGRPKGTAVNDQRLATIRATSKVNTKALEVAAMYLYSDAYASQNLSAADFYSELVDWRRNTVKRMVNEIVAATIP
jgi:hypothetical protein